MNTISNTLTQLSEHELLVYFETLVARDRRTTAQLLVAIAEIDERKLWARHACSSMFVFCVERFHMSEQVTAKRIWAARTARRFPVVLEMVERGELHLGAIHLLARHLTEENCSDVLRRAAHKSSREVERLVAALAPRPDVASCIRALPRAVVGAARPGDAAASGITTTCSESVPASAPASASATSAPATSAPESASAPESTAAIQLPPAQSPGGSPLPGRAARPITALSPRRYKIEITVDEETHDKLRSLQDLLGRSQVGRDPAAIISRAIDVLLVDTLKRKAATTDRPRPAPSARDAAPKNPGPASRSIPAAPENPEPGSWSITAGAADPGPRSRSIPAALRRTVWRRDCGRCRYVDHRGRRCNATADVEFHHKDPFARGGCHHADNLELRCAAHNQYEADLDFGRDFMDARRSAGARA